MDGGWNMKNCVPFNLVSYDVHNKIKLVNFVSQQNNKKKAENESSALFIKFSFDLV